MKALKSIFLFCILNSAFCISLNAQIVYTDVNPDSTSSGTYNLDINNDGTTDYSLFHSSSNAFGSQCSGTKINNTTSITCYGSNQIGSNTGTTLTWLPVNSVIDGSLLWNGSQTIASLTWTCEVCCMGFSHQWVGHSAGASATDKYLGLKLINNGNTYYGWILLNAYSTSFTVKGYAINTNVNQQILAGQTVWYPQLITTSALSKSTYNAGDSINVNYYKYGNFNAGNIFTAQLSDANGSFSSPVPIGSVNGNVTSTIYATVPLNVLYGTKYRVRVVASSPAFTAPDNYSDITIYPTQYASTSAVANLPWCAGQNVSVAYTATGNFNSGNIFKAQLSDANGSFASPVVIGTLSSITSGQISSTLPSNLLSGTKYRVRVISTNPASTGPDNGSDVTAFSSQISISISSSAPQRTCTVETYLLTCTVNNYYSYQWFKDGVAMGVSGTNFYQRSITQSGNYQCVVTTACGTAASNILPVTVHTIAPATITALSGSACANSVTMNGNIEAGRSYIWYRSSATGGNPVGGLTSYTATLARVYWLEEDSANCIYVSNEISVKFGKPNAKITVTGSLTFCAGDSVQLSASPFLASANPYTYQWKKGGVNISGATKEIYYAKAAGTYKVKVRNPYINCDSLSNGKTVTVNCRISEETTVVELEHLSIFPNPAKNILTIKFPSDEEGEMQIVNLFGQVVFSEKVNTELSQIDVSKFSQGMYVVRWSSGENSETKIFSVAK